MRRTLMMALLAGLALTACAAGTEQTAGLSSAGGGTETTAAEGDDVGEEAAAYEDGSQIEVALETTDANRQVIRRASLELHASDTRETFEEIVTLVESVGGFVANADVFPTSGEDAQPRVAMTLRVPVDDLNATLSAIKETADVVVAESQAAEDVTEQYIDLEARLTNLEALEIELRALLQEVRMKDDADPQKILRVFTELSSVRGQIEQIQGQLNHLDDLTTLATLEIQLTQTPAAVPIVEEPWSPTEAAKDALRHLVTGLQGAADWVINFALYALPMLLLTLGPLVVIAVYVYRKFFRRPPTSPTPAET